MSITDPFVTMHSSRQRALVDDCVRLFHALCDYDTAFEAQRVHERIVELGQTEQVDDGCVPPMTGNDVINVGHAISYIRDLLSDCAVPGIGVSPAKLLERYHTEGHSQVLRQEVAAACTESAGAHAEAISREVASLRQSVQWLRWACWGCCGTTAGLLLLNLLR